MVSKKCCVLDPGLLLPSIPKLRQQLKDPRSPGRPLRRLQGDLPQNQSCSRGRGCDGQSCRIGEQSLQPGGSLGQNQSLSTCTALSRNMELELDGGKLRPFLTASRVSADSPKDAKGILTCCLRPEQIEGKRNPVQRHNYSENI